MPEDKSNRIELALKEMSHCRGVQVHVGDNGTIVCIPKQRIFREARAGVKVEVVIDEDIRI